uniref:Uncharacterized protein n=1 Tax=Micrurus lemniscatus lemniscatus TaxID=129467 RepID=A0A2D4IK25_MICLE
MPASMWSYSYYYSLAHCVVPGSVDSGLFNREVDLSNLILTMNSLKWALANQFIYSLGDIQESYRGKEMGDPCKSCSFQLQSCPVDGTDLITFSSVQNSYAELLLL